MSSSSEITKQVGAICVGATTFALGVATGAAVGAIGLINLAATWRDLKSGCVGKTHTAAVRAAKDALAAAREFPPEDLDLAANLLAHLPEQAQFDPGPTVALLASGAFVPTVTATLIEQINPDPYATGAREILEICLSAALRACVQSRDFRDNMQWDVDLSTLQAVYRMDATMREMMARLDKSQGRELKLTHTAIVQLAKRISSQVSDFDEAVTALDDVVAAAERMQQAGQTHSNHPDFVDQVFARIAELNNASRFAEGLAAMEEALAREEEEHAARKSRLLTGGLDQARVADDPDAAARFELARLALDHPDPATRFDPLRKARRDWYERGRDKGLNFDLRVAIGLARESRAIATGSDQTGAALNDLGIALQVLGERDSDPDTLHQAVTAYREALKEYTRERVPLDWATTQNNLGTALKTLGERDSDPDTLHQAVTAYREALKEHTRERVPLDWAMTQNNLGTALQTLGARDSDPGTLHQAVTAYREALKERTRERVPLDWAMTQNNLGTTLGALGERDSDPDTLHQAVTAFRAALEERTRDKVPLDWAMTQNNLGNALGTLGGRDSDPATLQKAVTAYREALKEYTRERVPLNWAMTQNNLGNALRTLGERDSDPATLQQAVTAYREALKEYTRERVPLNWAFTQGNLCNLELVFFDFSARPDHLDRAQSCLDGTRAVFQQAGASQYLAMVDRQQAEIDRRRAALQG